MDEADVLPALLIASITLGVLLLLVSGAAFGRILADIEYQYAAGINGVRRIQSRVNLRTHGNRILLGLFALVTGILGLTDLTIVWRTWVGRVLFLLLLMIFALASVVDWLDERSQVRYLLKERADAQSSEGAP